MVLVDRLLDYKIEKSTLILKDAFNKVEKVAIAWSTGKDSTIILSLAKKLNPKRIIWSFSMITGSILILQSIVYEY